MAEKFTPGVFQAVDVSSLDQMRNEHQKQIDESKAKAKVWETHKAEYSALKEKLSTIADKTTHKVMVPFGGKKAFFEGQLVHTNEVMVLLGDNWFAERSAKESIEICDRRIASCNDMLENLDKEIQLYQSWLNEANNIRNDSQNGEGNLEIREEYDEEAEKEWRIRHRERVKEARRSEKENSQPNDDDESLWQRLDELELEEEMEEYQSKKALEDGQKSDQESVDEQSSSDEEDSDLSASPPLSDDEEASENYREEILKEIDKIQKKTPEIKEEVKQEASQSVKNATAESVSTSSQVTQPMPIKKSRFTVQKSTKKTAKIRFGEVSERLFSHEQYQTSAATAEEQPHETKVIEFESKDLTEPLSKATGKYPNHPGDIPQLYGLPQSPTYKGGSKAQTPKKSILRSKSKYGPLVKATKIVEKKPIVTAVNDAVVERQYPNAHNLNSGPVKATQAAIGDVVVERKPSIAFNTPSDENPSESNKDTKTVKISRFRATRVQK